MKKIALVHTMPGVLMTFEGHLRKATDCELKITNTLDTFLGTDPNEVGEITVNNLNRLYHILKAAEMTGADAVVVTCSTMSPGVKKLRPLIGVPLVAIDETTGREAVKKGSRIMVFASAPSAVEPTRRLIAEAAGEVGKEVTISDLSSIKAFEGLKTGDMASHDEALLENAKKIKDCDVVVLAQASMLHLYEKIAAISGVPVLASPYLCIENIKNILGL